METTTKEEMMTDLEPKLAPHVPVGTIHSDPFTEGYLSALCRLAQEGPTARKVVKDFVGENGHMAAMFFAFNIEWQAQMKAEADHQIFDDKYGPERAPL